MGTAQINCTSIEIFITHHLWTIRKSHHHQLQTWQFQITNRRRCVQKLIENERKECGKIRKIPLLCYSKKASKREVRLYNQQKASANDALGICKKCARLIFMRMWNGLQTSRTLWLSLISTIATHAKDGGSSESWFVHRDCCMSQTGNSSGQQWNPSSQHVADSYGQHCGLTTVQQVSSLEHHKLVPHLDCATATAKATTERIPANWTW
jgi:hypothetical protein